MSYILHGLPWWQEVLLVPAGIAFGLLVYAVQELPFRSRNRK